MKIEIKCDFEPCDLPLLILVFAPMVDSDNDLAGGHPISVRKQIKNISCQATLTGNFLYRLMGHTTQTSL